MAWQGYHLITFEWTLFAIATVFASVRIWVQLRFRTRPWREVLIVAAWLMYFSCTLNESILNGYDAFNYAVTDYPEYVLRYAGVVKFVYAFTYILSFFACKAALLLFYNDLTQRHLNPKTWWSIAVAWFFIVVAVVFVVLRNLLVCRPISLNWTIDPNEKPCWSVAPLMLTGWSFHVLTDLIVFTIPFAILHNLHHLTWRDKSGAAAMFAVGLLNTTCAILHLTASVMVNYNTAFVIGEGGSHIIYDALYWLLPAQQGTAIIVVCMPQVRRLWLGTSAEALRRRRDRAGQEQDEEKDVSGYGSMESGSLGVSVVSSKGLGEKARLSML